jgi:hypothetical protein
MRSGFFSRRRALSIGVARMFVFVYLLASLFASLHQHVAGVSGGGGHAASLCADGGDCFSAPDAADGCSVTDTCLTASGLDCPTCEFVAHLVSPAVRPVLSVRATLIAGPIPAPAPRPQPYLPYRFCARSASRAPPAA